MPMALSSFAQDRLLPYVIMYAMSCPGMCNINVHDRESQMHGRHNSTSFDRGCLPIRRQRTSNGLAG